MLLNVIERSCLKIDQLPLWSFYISRPGKLWLQLVVFSNLFSFIQIQSYY